MDEKYPQRPEGTATGEGTASSPRIEIEPTPQAPQGAAPASAFPAQPTAPRRERTGWRRARGRPCGPIRCLVGKPLRHRGPGAANAAVRCPAGSSRRRRVWRGPRPPFVSGALRAGQTVTHTVVKTKTKKLPVFVSSLAGLVVGAVLVIALVMTGALRIGSTNVDAPALSDSGSNQTIQIDAEDTTLAEAVSAKALPSVVSITAVNEGSGEGGIGSGVILDTDGNILTNYHVIGGATTINVSTNDGASYEAELVGQDESSDLAVIRLQGADASSLTPIEIGDSDSLTVGEWVMAIGSPFGNEQSVSTGIVSALYRSTAMQSTSGTTIYANMIQTDAAINPGNSGGALVNDNGELIGINSMIESYSGSSSGVGFAIPVNYAINIAQQIIDGETPRTRTSA